MRPPVRSAGFQPALFGASGRVDENKSGLEARAPKGGVRTSATAALVFLLAPGAALAQQAGAPLSPNDPSAVVARPSPPSRPITPPPAAPGAAPADDTPRFVLTSVTFDGAAAIPVTRLAPAWTPWRGRPVTLANLAAIARATEAIYAASGYPFVAVVLNPQRVVGGAVRFKVVEGHIANLTVLGADPRARRQATAAFEPLVDRIPLTAADVEGAYERAKTVPGLAVAGALHRGATPGGMDLLVQAKREEWLLYANVNDLYPDALGPWGGLIGLDHYGDSVYGDVASAQVYESLDGGRQTVARLSYARGLDASGTTIDLSVLGAWADPGRAVAPLDLATNVATARIAISQPIIARLAQTLTVTGAFEVNNQKTEVFSNVGLSDDKLRILSLAAAGEWRYRGDARVSFTAEIRQGLDILGASHRGDADLSRQGADPAATVGRLSVEGLSPAFHKVRLDLRVEGQLASAPLTAPEQYLAGNLTIGRGYQPGADFGDDALAASAEVRFGPYPLMTRYSISPFGFYDSAQVWTRTPGAPTGRVLASTGAGVRIETPNRLHIEITYAQALRPPLGLGESTPHGRLLVNVTMGLNGIYDTIRRRLFPGVSR
ncbi:MAG TPA: POTRA domain-containing protein [Caulobacteraceae bacterium]|nr:POTRA domain-containing protein [Caulobacteraceae bacterium]